jgi:hypothetical protein
MSNSPDTNDIDTDSPFDLIPYDDTFNDEDFVAELIAEGYSEEEAKRMAGEYDADDDEYCFGDGDRDIPDFVDEEDFG